MAEEPCKLTAAMRCRPKPPQQPTNMLRCFKNITGHMVSGGHTDDSLGPQRLTHSLQQLLLLLNHGSRLHAIIKQVQSSRCSLLAAGAMRSMQRRELQSAHMQGIRHTYDILLRTSHHKMEQRACSFASATISPTVEQRKSSRRLKSEQS